MSPATHAVVETYVLPLQLLLAMLGMGADLRIRDFADVAKSPRSLALGVVLQMVFVPALALAFIAAFDLSPGWAVGLLLVAVVPGGTVSNLFTHVGTWVAAAPRSRSRSPR
jgi:BASS family bile acid:Na+ symporter